MLLSLDPDRMAQLGLTVADVQAAVQEQNTTNPAGRIGREPAPPGNQLTLPVTTLGRLTDPKEFADIIVRANSDGSLVRVKDIGRVTLGAQSYDLVGRVNGIPTAAIRLYLRPGANALNVKQAVVARMNELARNFPAGVSWFIPFDTTPFITASIDEVVKTLFEAMVLVTLVVFIFLQSWRTTLIPVLAVPVAIIGTFFGLQLLGFEINLLTLFALVLAIGIVVDDAIVVIENVERIMARGEAAAAGGRRPGHGSGGERTGGDRALPLRRVSPGGVSRRDHRPDVQAVRHHARGRGSDLRHRGAHAHAGALRGPAEAQLRASRATVCPPGSTADLDG